jgi:hypothetical protein
MGFPAFVIAGHSPSKTGVNALVPRQSIVLRRTFLMDARVKPAHDEWDARGVKRGMSPS